MQTSFHVKQLIEAREFCRAAHESIDHRRKYNNKPYFDAHCMPVAMTVAVVMPDNYNAICAAFAHDVLEDVTPLNKDYDAARICEVMGQDVLDLIIQLTHKYESKSFPTWNRARRKAAEAERLSKSSDLTKTIKLADCIDNSADISANDPGFAITYIKEIAHLLPLLRVRGFGPNEILFDIASEQVYSIAKSLDICLKQ